MFLSFSEYLGKTFFYLFFFLLRKGKGGRPPSLGPSSCYTLATGLNKKILQRAEAVTGGCTVK